MGFIPGRSDPFYAITAPPPDETPAQRMARQKREADAQRVSDQIDEDIKRELAALKKEKNVVKVLLLGQAESGKSTTLKNFRMLYNREEWERERNGWRAVVQLNIIMSINTILRAVEEEIHGEISSVTDDEVSIDESTGLGDWHRMLMIRLTSLKEVERELRRRIGAATEDIVPTNSPSIAFPNEDLPPSRTPLHVRAPTVRSWDDVLFNGRSSTSSNPSEISHSLADCREDMIALWHDPAVNRALKKRQIHMSDSAGFFLDDLNRIASRDYVVTDGDIVRARLRTLGVKEHRLMLPHGPWDSHHSGRDGGWQWRIYDVPGCRPTRKTWVPYFQHVNVILFLSPVSAFDQKLEEDHKVNRLEDSLEIWKHICKSKLLEKIQLICLLNKCDLLRQKLKRGVRISKYVSNYKEREEKIANTDSGNKATAFVKYLSERYRYILKLECGNRPIYIHPTSVVDTSKASVTIESVRDNVLRNNLDAAQLI